MSPRRPLVVHLATTDVTHRFLLLPQMEQLRDEGWDVLAVSAPGRWVKDVEAAGIRFEAWPHATRAWNPRADVAAYRALVTLLRRERPAVLHCHNPKPGVLGRVAGRVAGVPVVLNTVHGLYATPADAWTRKLPVLAAELFASRFADLDFYQSGEDIAWAARRSIARPGRAVLLGNGIDLGRFGPDAPGRSRAEVRRELGIDEDAIVVGTVGRMVGEKGYRELFRAAASIAGTHPRVRFLAVGEPDAEKADRLSDEELRRAGPNVVVAGWREDVPDLLRAMDLFVLPSWREGLPRSAIEAAASGLPLVLTDIRGCREVADDGRCGLLVPPRDAPALAGAIRSLIDDDRRRAELGAAARRRAGARFDERRVRTQVAHATRALVPVGRSGDGAKGILRRARPADAEWIASLHVRTLPDGFLSTVGEPFLRRFYGGLARDRASILVVAEVDGLPAGFACATPSLRRFAVRFALRAGPSVLVSLAPVLRRPGVLRGLAESAVYAKRDGATAEAGAAELVAVAVDPARRGGGIGRRLVSTAVDAMAARGSRRVRVLVDQGNAAGIGLYRSMGFASATAIAVHADTHRLVLVRTCSAS